MATVREMITRTLRLINVIAQNETPSAQEADDALSVLNEMIDSWALQRGLILEEMLQTFSLVPGQQTYSMGVGANFNTPRPTKIEYATLRVVGAQAYERELIMLDKYQWANIALKSITSSIPQYLWVANDEPNLLLNFWPIPTAANQIILGTWEALTEFTNLDAQITMPRGFRKAIRYNLAMELAPEYGKEPSAVVATEANNTLAWIKRANPINPLADMDPALTSAHRGTFNYLLGV